MLSCSGKHEVLFSTLQERITTPKLMFLHRTKIIKCTRKAEKKFATAGSWSW